MIENGQIIKSAFMDKAGVESGVSPRDERNLVGCWNAREWMSASAIVIHHTHIHTHTNYSVTYRKVILFTVGGKRDGEL